MLRSTLVVMARNDCHGQASAWQLLGGEFNRSTQHPSLEHTDCWCRSNFSIKGQDIRHRSRSFERLRRYPPVLAALPALSALCLQLQHEPCPCMSLHMHAIPTWRIRVKGCCVDRLSPPGKTGRDSLLLARRFMTHNGASPPSNDAMRKVYSLDAGRLSPASIAGWSTAGPSHRRT